MSTRLEQLFAFEKSDPSDPFIQFAIAKEYEKFDDKAQALQRYESIRENHPDYIGLYYHLGHLYEALLDKERALQTYIDGLELAKNTKDFHSASELNNAKMNLEMDL